MHGSEDLVERILVSVLSLDLKDRAGYLDRACGDKPELRSKVEQLLEEHDHAGSFLMHPLLPALHRKATNQEAPRTAAKMDGAAGHEGRGEDCELQTTQFKTGELIYEGRFEVMRYIAQGGMGEVYEVKDLQLNDVRVAMKTIRSRHAADPLMRERFRREVLVARKISHPHVCPIYDLFTWERPAGQLLFLTMKLLEGETLAQRLARSGPLPLSEIAIITSQVGSGLASAHAEGVLHRDIKAPNIMLTGTGSGVHACITDFGLARPAEQDSTALTVEGVLGTPGYLAPELYYGAVPSQASDVFAFGVVVYQMFTGCIPRNPITDPKVLRKMHEAGVPAPWRQLIEGCMQPIPGARCNDIASVLRMLPAVALDSVPRTAPIPVASSARLLSRRRILTLAGVTLVASGTGALARWERIKLWFEPLPKKRFVALMAWPNDESSNAVEVILSSIESRLARLESGVRNLLIITAKDVPGANERTTAPAACVKELGANLVLAAALHFAASTVTLTLQVLDASTQRVLRRSEIRGKPQTISALTDAAPISALRLLDLPEKDPQLSDEEELNSLPAYAFHTFSEAEHFASELTEASLNESILKYEQVVHDQKRFALGHARLAIAYARLFHLTGEKALLDMVGKNADRARILNPHSVTALFGQALAQLYAGHNDAALTILSDALKSDPNNSEFMFYRALAYRNIGGDKNLNNAAAIYKHIIDDVRPNYWPAYNEWGFVLAQLKKYDDAATQFERAAAVAPNVALPLANLATMYFEKDDNGDPKQKLENKTNAIAACQRSLVRGSNDQANIILGSYAWLDRDYTTALAYYQEAAKDDPHNDTAWCNIADCYVKLNRPALAQQNYTRAAQTLSAFLAANPSKGTEWATLAVYHAKVNEFIKAQTDIDNASLHNATDVDSQFRISMALAAMHRKEEALPILLQCIDRGLSTADVELAPDLESLRRDPRYIAHIAQLRRSRNGTVS